jgi:hypothetical protein
MKASLHPFSFAMFFVSSQIVLAVAFRCICWVENMRHTTPTRRRCRIVFDVEVAILPRGRVPRPVVEAI